MLHSIAHIRMAGAPAMAGHTRYSSRQSAPQSVVDEEEERPQHAPVYDIWMIHNAKSHLVQCDSSSINDPIRWHLTNMCCIHYEGVMSV